MVLSVHNRYGHPYGDVLKRPKASGAEIYRTDIDGAIVMEISNERIKFVK
ncbi:MAG: hypothetical protein ACNYPH_05180 [Gammaproteobacteria bacterium WSBS_2016_MAG_OTU1]